MDAMACPVGVHIKWVSLYMYARFREGFLLGFGESFGRRQRGLVGGELDSQAQVPPWLLFDFVYSSLELYAVKPR